MANNEAMQVQDAEQAVRQHGFAAVRTRTHDILVLSIEKAFEMFGEDCSKVLREVRLTHDQIEGLLKGLGRIMNTAF